MSWRTSQLAICARSIGRRVGVNRLLAVALSRRGYEEDFHNELCGYISPGDCVWDVGANIGHYTQLFSTHIGSEGRVFAFEPSPLNYERLETQCGVLSNVTLLNLGLGSREGRVSFQQGADDLGATSRIVEAEQSEHSVTIHTGDSLLEQRVATSPDVIKIDVEGFEWDVLQGLRDIISSQDVKAIGVELHFGLLQQLGHKNAPADIEQFLKRAGFNISWPDASHIIAVSGNDAAR